MHDLQHPLEVPRPSRPLERLPDRAGIRERQIDPRRVDLLDRRRPDEIDPVALRDGEIRRFVARVRVEILARTELQRVHEDGYDHAVLLGACALDQRAMPGMECAHRGHQADRVPGRPPVVGSGFQLRGGPDQIHRAVIERRPSDPGRSRPPPGRPRTAARPSRSDRAPPGTSRCRRTPCRERVRRAPRGSSRSS